jgi:UDPglucose 6-dehydrogenase
MTTTAFLGLSHLGIVSSIGWASFGRPVIGVDPDTQLVANLSDGQLPVHEPGLPELLGAWAASIRFTSDLDALSECSLVIVSRDVPTDANNESDLGPVRALIELALPRLGPNATLVVMSQVPPGFTSQLQERVRMARPDARITVYCLVETLIFGDAVNRTLHPERFIIGCEKADQPLTEALQAGLEAFGCPILKMAYASAELTKTAINLYLIGSVTYANTLADLCESLNANWSEMIPALRLDKRIGPAAYLRPSLGIAGGNLERDLVTLQGLGRGHKANTTYLDALMNYNAARFDWVMRHLRARVLIDGATPTIGVWGLAYKRDTRSTKNSPALRLIETLKGQAHVRAWDPAVGADDVAVAAEVTGSVGDVLVNADCLVIMNDWDAFVRADLGQVAQLMRRPLIVDCPGVLQPRRAELRDLRIDYIAMGEPACVAPRF